MVAPNATLIAGPAAAVLPSALGDALPAIMTAPAANILKGNRKITKRVRSA